MVRGILRVRLRVRARRDGCASGRGCRDVDFDVGDGMAFDVVRVEAVAARREVHCGQSAKTRLLNCAYATHRPAGSAWHSAG